jgi:diguanylate cyclase
LSRIKIDQSFGREMLIQPDCEAIVKSVIGLARELRIEVVAEGVEIQEQLHYLRQTNCNEVQGCLIGRPMSEDQACSLFSAPREEPAHAA